MPYANIHEAKRRLDERNIEYVITRLHDTTQASGNERETHAVQYFNERGSDILLIVIGDDLAMAAHNGVFSPGNKALIESGVICP